MLAVALFLASALLAYSNGANDNFKGVASLYASRTVGYRTALALGTGATFAGSVAALFLAEGLLSAFSGKGLVPPSVAGGEVFLVGVALGAGGTVLLATRLGFPISTTHALVGGIVGAGLVTAGTELSVVALGSVFLLPLLASPLVALGLAAVIYRLAHDVRRSVGIRRDGCLCVAAAAEPVSIGAGPFGAVGARSVEAGDVGSSGSVSVDGSVSAGGATGPRLGLLAASEHECTARYSGVVMGVRWQSLVDSAHVLSAGAVSFARGLNDTPKIAALLLAIHFLDVPSGLVLVGVGMAVGGILGARRVAATLGDRITSMNHGQGLAANVATAVLVLWASRLGVPVSTTHVSVGSLFGIGLTTSQANLPVIRNVVVSWVVTLPCAAILAWTASWLAAPLAGS